MKKLTDVEFFDRKFRPFGRSWEEWVELWWKWCYSEPYDTNPVSDTTGKSCCKNQAFKDTWFLAGTFGGKAERECKIPFGRSIFFPVVNDLISFAEYPELETEDNLHGYAKMDLDTATYLSLKVDGTSVQRLWDYRVHSNLFEIKIPLSNNIESRIKTSAVSEGYWAFIRSLPRGAHVLSFVGEKEAFDQIKADICGVTKKMFTVSVVYHLLVF